MRRTSKRPANRNVANRISAGRADARSPLNVRLTVLVAALGYFVDIYDLVLFGIVRVASLKSLGVTGDALLGQGVLLLNMQMGGMLVGGILWGIIGDKRGRLSVLFGSIFLYSIANIANGLAQSVSQYAVLRVIAGVGLAGESKPYQIVSERCTRKHAIRTTLVAGVGLSEVP
jgi:MFS family permease